MLRAAAASCVFLAAGVACAAEPAPGRLEALQAAYARVVVPGAPADLHRELLATVLERVQRTYATEVDGDALVDAALKVVEPLPAGAGEPTEVFRKTVNAALATLDPHSRWLDPSAHAVDRSGAGGSFGGLGLQVEGGDGGVRVVAPIPDSPAARAGLREGDVIVRVDEQPLLGVPLPEAITRLRGAPGTPVALTVRRSAEEFTVALTRDTIRRQLLRWSMEGEVLVLRLGSFSGAVGAALAQAVAEATAAHAPRAVVLDLRGNPGGLLREAVRLADAFLGEGDIVSLRGRAPSSQRTWKAEPGELLPGLPLVVLIDRRSASASELVAASLQDHGRAIVMGQRSFGKGTVQTTFALGEGKGALKLTTSHYHAPSGRAVQRTGVGPDIELLAADKPPAREAEGAGIAPVRVDQGRCAPVVKAPDPALSCAVAYLRGGSVEAFLGALRPAVPSPEGAALPR